MSKLRVLSGRVVCAILEVHGFREVRQRGSHIVMQRLTDGENTTGPVPVTENFVSELCDRSSGNPGFPGPSLRRELVERSHARKWPNRAKTSGGKPQRHHELRTRVAFPGIDHLSRSSLASGQHVRSAPWATRDAAPPCWIISAVVATRNHASELGWHIAPSGSLATRGICNYGSPWLAPPPTKTRSGVRRGPTLFIVPRNGSREEPSGKRPRRRHCVVLTRQGDRAVRLRAEGPGPASEIAAA